MLLPARRLIVLLLGLAIAPAMLAAPQNRPASSAPARVSFQPKFTPGQVVRYHLLLESNSTIRQVGVIHDQEGPARLDIAWDATIRLEASAAPGTAAPVPGTAGALAPVRLRITYESSTATIRSAAPEPRSDEIQQQYAQLAGRSLEFTLAADGSVSDVHGLEGLVDDDKARDALQQWITQLSAATGAPAGGVIPGQKWNSTRAADLPIAGLSWRTDATYLSNAPCRAANSSETSPAPSSASERGDCAVIQSRLALITTRSLRDLTPDDYRQRGLHTSGHWTGSGQGLLYVSLDTGSVVSSSQDSTEEMDVTVASRAINQPGFVRQSGSVTTNLQISVLPADAPAATPPAR